MLPMKNRTRLLFLILLVFLCSFRGSAQESIFGRTAPPAPAVVEPGTPPAPPQPSEVLALFSLREKVSQLMLVTLQGLYGPIEPDARLLKDYPPGAVLLRQIAHPENAANYVNGLRRGTAGYKARLLIGANLFSLVQRDRNAASGFIQLPSLLAISAAHDPETTARLGRLLAEYVHTLGLDFHFGPNLELAPQVADAKGSIHNFGSDPVFAAEAGAALVRALEDRQILAMPSGFPGGGADRTDKSAAVLLTPRPLLSTTTLLPFQSAFAEGVRAVHVANTLVPTLDPQSPPASQSETVMRELLRGDLAFQGLIVAGPMDSAVMSAREDTAQGALTALQRGADMVYWQSSADTVMRAVDRIVRAVQAGEWAEEDLDRKVLKVLLMKAPTPVEPRQELKTKQLAQLEKDKKLLQETFEVERRSITLIQNRNQVLPLTKERSMPIGVTGVVHLDVLSKELEKVAKPISEQRIATALHVGDIDPIEIERLTSGIRNYRTIVCVLAEGLRPRGQVELIRALKGKGVNVVVVYLGYPEHVVHLLEADAVVLGYCSTADYQQTLRAVGEVLRGEAPVRIYGADETLQARVGEVRSFNAYEIALAPAGRLPVTLSEAMPAGYAVPYDPSRAIKKLQWDLGDGTKGKDPQISHAYKQPGLYTVSLSITGVRGDVISRTFSLEVTP
jgi:beta-N-acetylhexosaminidase